MHQAMLLVVVVIMKRLIVSLAFFLCSPLLVVSPETVVHSSCHSDGVCLGASTPKFVPSRWG